MIPPVRRRIAKAVSLAIHAARSFQARGRLNTLAQHSSVASAIDSIVRGHLTKHEQAVMDQIRAERRRLYSRQDEIYWRLEDPLDPATAPPAHREIVGIAANIASVKPHWGRLLFSLVREVKPEVCLELGACFGISGLYIQAALREVGRGRLVTIEGSAARAEIAADLYRRMGFQQFSVLVGDFDRQLPRIVAELKRVDLAFIDGNHRLEPTLHYDAMIRSHAGPGAVIVHDDIRWSAEMDRAWNTIVARPGSRYVFDLFRFGIVELGHSADHPEVVPASLGMAHLR